MARKALELDYFRNGGVTFRLSANMQSSQAASFIDSCHHTTILTPAAAMLLSKPSAPATILPYSPGSSGLPNSPLGPLPSRTRGGSTLLRCAACIEQGRNVGDQFAWSANVCQVLAESFAVKSHELRSCFGVVCPLGLRLSARFLRTRTWLKAASEQA